MNSMPAGVIWPCYENGTPVRFGEVIDNGIGHFPAKSIRFNENGWVIYDSGNPANAKFAETGHYDEHATRYVEPDSWSKWHKDMLTLMRDGACAYFDKKGSRCYGCPAFKNSECGVSAVSDLEQRAIKLAERDR